MKGEGIQDPQINRKGRRTKKSRSEAEANKQRKRSSVADTEMNLSVRNLDKKKQRTQIQEEEVVKYFNSYLNATRYFHLENEQEEKEVEKRT